MPDILCVFRLQVGNLKPHFLGPKWSELKNLSAYQQEDFLGYPKLTLLFTFKLRAIFEGVMAILKSEAFFWDTLYMGGAISL